MAEESAVKVCVRVRRPIAREEGDEPVQLFWKADQKSICQTDDGNSTKTFSFDRVFTSEETTSQLYRELAKPLVASTVEGYNGTIFAYGQTSSGKTFTMMGSDQHPGVIPLAVEDVFETIKNYPKKEFLLRVSYMEIYNETVTDLLVDSWKRKPLEVREAINKNVYVADLTEELVTSSSQVLSWIRKGEKNRHYGETKMNQHSSRSHTIFRMILESRERSDPASGESTDGAILVSHLNLVDLAGSERASQTGAEGTRFKEGCMINRSLFTLGQVIKKLTDESQKGFTNYRDSKLTRILQNSLGGNAKTIIICTITPATVNETLSTLQFASTAKKMKNDPYVTEVSDDGALLKRYRNEIDDLKRRLSEVSSITHTTATEREVLSQLLQEKDQLQREQEDRIKNLTKLLVTSANVVSVRKMPKRRVTWGGKMMAVAGPSAGDSPADPRFGESFTWKRKAELSCLTEFAEDDEDSDSQWKSSTDHLEMNQSSVTGGSPMDYVAPDSIRDQSGKIFYLEMQLEMENRHKEEAIAKVAELSLQLQTEAGQKEEAWEKILTTEQRAAELELQQQDQAQQKLESTETVQMLELRVNDLERRLEEQKHTQTEYELMKGQFGETIQLCETLASEKDAAVVESDYLKRELGIFLEQIGVLEKENAALSKEVEEKRATEEFKSLEEEINKEHEIDLQNELSKYKEAIESTKTLCQELQDKVDALSGELKKKNEFNQELQMMSGKDLVLEVTTLRQSLDDAMGLSQDSKKEWAVIRSQNIELEEKNTTLTLNLEKIEAEVTSLRSHLEMEKSSYRAIKTDLQKELTFLFEENTKLNAVLEGKVPNDLMERVEAERTLANVSKELRLSREAEGALRAQLEEQASFQTQNLDSLMKRVSELSEELSAVQTQRDGLLSDQARWQEETRELRDSLRTSQDERFEIQADLSAASVREQGLIQQGADTTLQLNSLHSDLERSHVENRLLVARVEEGDLKLEKYEQERTTLMERLDEMKQLIQDLEKRLADSEVSPSAHESQELKQQNESDAEAQHSAEEYNSLLSKLTSVTAERDQLKMDMQENVEMMIENQEDLRAALEKNMKQKELLRHLETLHTSGQDETSSEMRAQLEVQKKQAAELQATIQVISEEKSRLESDLQRSVEMVAELQCQLQSLQAELQNRVEQCRRKESEQQTLTEQLENGQLEGGSVLTEQQAGRRSSAEDEEQLQCRLKSLCEDRDQLLETLQGLREEKLQIRAETEDKMDALLCEIKTLTEKLENADAERDSLLREKEASCQSSSVEKEEQLQCSLKSLCEDRDQLLETLQVLREEKLQIRAEMEDQMDSLQSEIRALTEKLSNTETERDSLLREKEASCQSSSVEKEEQLQCSLKSLCEDRDQLLETLQGLREEKLQIRTEMEDQMDALQSQIKTLTEKLEIANAERDSLLREKEASCQSSSVEKEEQLQCSLKSLCEDRDQLLETLQGLREEKLQIRAEMEDQMDSHQSEIRALTEKLSNTETERDSLLREKEASCQSSSVEKEEQLQWSLKSLCEDRDQLLETLQGLREEKLQIRAEMEDQMDVLQSQIKTLTEKLEIADAERDSLLREKEASCQSSSVEKEDLMCSLKSLSEDRDQLLETLQGLREEKLQIRAEMEDQMDSHQSEIRALTEKLEISNAERDSLLREKEASCQSSSVEKEDLMCRLKSLCEDRDQLLETLQGLREEKLQIRAEMEDKMNTLQSEMKILTGKLENTEMERDGLRHETQANCQSSSDKEEQLQCSLKSLSEELLETLQGLREEKLQIRAETEDKMDSLQSEIKTLTEKLENADAERDGLLREKEASCQSSSVEKEEQLQCSLKSLCEDRDQLLETLQGLREEKLQIRAEMEDKINTLQSKIKTLTEKLEISNAERDSLLREKEASCQSSSVEKEDLMSSLKSLCEDRDQLLETLKGLREEKLQIRAEMEDKMDALQSQFPSKAGAASPAVGQRQSTLGGGSSVNQATASRLKDSTVQLQETFEKLREVVAACSMGEQEIKDDLAFFSNPPANSCSATNQQGLELSQTLNNFVVCLKKIAQDYMGRFEALVEKDLAVFDERRLQDVLLRRAEPRTLSVRDERFGTLWEHRLTELLEKRQRCQEKMSSFVGTLVKNLFSFYNTGVALVTDMKKHGEQSTQVAHRIALIKTMLQDSQAEHAGLSEELKTLEAQAHSQLTQERSKSSTLLLNSAATQPLRVQLQDKEEKLKAVHAQNEQLEEAQIQVNDRLSNHKQATQLLQSELQDCRAQNDDNQKTIEALRDKLRASEKKASPSAAELERVQARLFKLEVELSSASDSHQQEIQRMNTVLSVKENALRTLKETLRRQQQEGEETCTVMQGKDLHAKLINPQGLGSKSGLLLDTTKLKEEVKRLCLKITELESLVSTQKAEIAQWKHRAIALKAKSKAEAHRPASPCALQKRSHVECASSPVSSPKRVLLAPTKARDSPNPGLLDSPKSRFFDVGGSPAARSRTCPKQFFDNSSLGTIPDSASASDLDIPGSDETCPWSPKKEDLCKTQ